jgi:hypothetical protein
MLKKMEECEEAAKSNNFQRYFSRIDSIESQAKCGLLNGIISNEQLDKIFRRYGMR